jgi:hypothetical protein
MTAQSEMPGRVIKRRTIVHALVLLAAAVPIVYFAGSCATAQPTGACIRSDTTIVARDVTQNECTNRCRLCTWRQG